MKNVFTTLALLILVPKIIFAVQRIKFQITIPSLQLFPCGQYLEYPGGRTSVDAQSDAYVQSIGMSKNLHPIFGSGYMTARRLEFLMSSFRGASRKSNHV